MRIIELTAAEIVNVRAPHTPDLINVKTREYIELTKNEVGIILGKKSLMRRGVLCQSGIVHPGFKGCLSPYLLVYGNFVISVGVSIAHVVIFSEGKNDNKNSLKSILDNLSEPMKRTS